MTILFKNSTQQMQQSAAMHAFNMPPEYCRVFFGCIRPDIGGVLNAALNSHLELVNDEPLGVENAEIYRRALAMASTDTLPAYHKKRQEWCVEQFGTVTEPDFEPGDACEHDYLDRKYGAWCRKCGDVRKAQAN